MIQDIFHFEDVVYRVTHEKSNIYGSFAKYLEV